ncbi:MAG: hypothetical protein O3A39_12140 [Proteobacteria bacterium]|nr:hypothetical protein [Pseudomonadota bacterium]
MIFFISSCNHDYNNELMVVNHITNKLNKPFILKWIIEKKSITSLPQKTKDILKSKCINYSGFSLVKIASFSDDTVKGTFVCRI